MKKNKEELSYMLQSLFIKFNDNTNMYNYLKQYTKNRLGFGKLEDVFDNRNRIHTYLDDSELYWLAKGTYEYVKKHSSEIYSFNIEDLNIENYFTQQEESQAQYFFITSEDTTNKILELKNVAQVDEGEFVCYFAPYDVIAKAYKNGITIYNFETQREPDIVEIFGEMVLKPRVYKDSVLEIYQDMKEGLFKPNTITWNILDNGEAKFEYDSKTQTLYLDRTGNSQNAILDGFHRTLAIVKLLSEQPNFKGHMILHIFNYNIREAQNFIIQESKGRKITKHRIKTFESNKFNTIAKGVNSYENKESNSLFNMLTDLPKEVYQYHAKYMTLLMFAKGVEIIYGDLLQVPRDNARVKLWLVEFFNEYIGYFHNEFEDIARSRQDKVVTYNNCIIGAMALSRYYFEHQDNWRKAFNRLVSTTDWSISNPNWQNIKLISSREDKKTLKRIAKHFNQLAKNNQE